MSEWNTVISVLGTLGGTTLGLVLGYWTSSHLETKRQKHEREMEYRKELAKHMDDIIKPLFHFIEELWGSLANLGESVRMKSSIVKRKTLKELLIDAQNAEQKLQKFYNLNYSQMNLLLPFPIPLGYSLLLKSVWTRFLFKYQKGNDQQTENSLLSLMHL